MTATAIQWQGCYERSWRGLITPESFTHPAKFAPGLIDRIYTHGLAAGWWNRGHLIGDPFGGIAGGGVIAGYHGLNWFGVELEKNFVDLGCQNLFLHVNRWQKLGTYGGAGVTFKQGDSRRFAEIVGEAAGIVTSPPYADSIHDGNGIDPTKFQQQRFGPNSQALAGGYGEASGQIGRLAAGNIDSIVTSPPFTTDQPCASQSQLRGNIQGAAKRAHGCNADGNIQSLKTGELDGVVTSPPWEADACGTLRGEKFKDPAAFAAKMAAADGKNGRHAASAKSRLAQMERDRQRTYGDTAGNVGNQSGETYWQAMHQVYRQCHIALKPGGVMAVVVKDYVKDRQRVPLCDQTLKLLQHLGFKLVCRIHAMLTREVSHPGLFNGEPITRKHSRKSFFRRLAEKNGSPAIDWEEVIVVRKPQRTRRRAAPGAALSGFSKGQDATL